MDAPPPFECWSEGGCLYRCAPCGSTFRHSVAFWKHVAEFHRLDPADFGRLFPRPRVKKVAMRCDECGQEITFDRGKMEAHMIRRHDGMTLREYYDKHIAKRGTF